jgi:hypothetical protein
VSRLDVVQGIESDPRAPGGISQSLLDELDGFVHETDDIGFGRAVVPK